MDDNTFLLWIDRGRIAAAFLVAIGVAGEFLGEFIARPINKRRESGQLAEIARLTREAEEAKKTAEGFKLEIATANTKAASAQERAEKASEHIAFAEEQAAQANKAAESERLARLKIEERLAPRRLSPDQCASFRANLIGAITSKVEIFFVSTDPETADFASDLEGCFKQAGIIVESTPAIILGHGQHALLLTVGRDRMGEASTLARALIAALHLTAPMSAERAPENSPGMLKLTVFPK